MSRLGINILTKSDNKNTTIVSQDFGENKYNKNIRVTTQILQLCHKTLEGISTAKQHDNVSDK